MDLNAQKEEFSYAYIRAVASVAGYSVEDKRRPMDNAGVDLTIEVPGEIGTILFPKLDAQVKCTSSQHTLHQDCINFPLDVKNYNVLRHKNPLTPILLILILVPDNLKEWLNISEEDTVMKRCGYWVSLKGKPPTDNSKRITIAIPKRNLFTPESLSSIMEKIVKGEDL